MTGRAGNQTFTIVLLGTALPPEPQLPRMWKNSKQLDTGPTQFIISLNMVVTFSGICTTLLSEGMLYKYKTYASPYLKTSRNCCTFITSQADKCINLHILHLFGVVFNVKNWAQDPFDKYHFSLFKISYLTISDKRPAFVSFLFLQESVVNSVGV